MDGWIDGSMRVYLGQVDVHAVSNMISKLALDTMLRTGVSAARTFLHKTIVDIVRAYRNATSAAPTAFPAISAAPQNAGVTLPEELKQLPLFGLALQVCEHYLALRVPLHTLHLALVSIAGRV